MPKKSKQGDAQKEIKRQWGDLEVIDAENELRVFIQTQDLKNATRKDPGCCVFAQACKRAFNSTKVMFLLRYAYVELPGPDGTRRVERFMMTGSMRKLVEKFDRGETIIPEAGFLLKPPTESHRLNGTVRRKEAARKKAARKKALISGGSIDKTNSRHANRSRPLTIDAIRSGVGQVHFPPK